jgi:hypothetical protein
LAEPPVGMSLPDLGQLPGDRVDTSGVTHGWCPLRDIAWPLPNRALQGAGVLGGLYGREGPV